MEADESVKTNVSRDLIPVLGSCAKRAFRSRTHAIERMDQPHATDTPHSSSPTSLGRRKLQSVLRSGTLSHEVLYRDGWQLTSEPTLSATRRLPDYFVERDEECFYLEATTMSHHKKTSGAERRLQTVLCAIDQTVLATSFSTVIICQDARPSRLVD